jgi:carboxyl-terminal processing protease
MMALLPTLLIVLSALLSACNLLIPLNEDETLVTGEFGPAASAKEHQTRTFEALWKNIEDFYVYFDIAEVDWTALHDQYQARIDSGLSEEEFSSLIQDLEKELPEGSLIYQSRSDRIQADMTDISTYEGIGAFIGFEEKAKPHIVILDVIEGSPAEKAGLRAHDSIFGIDGSPILLEEGLSASDRIRGPAGSTVTLNVKTPGKSERSVEVARAKLASTGKLAVYNVTGTNYGYLLFPPLGYQGLDQEVFKGLQTLATNRRLEGLILDLRIVNSSSNWPVDALLTIFSDGEIGEVYNRTNKQPLEIEGQDLIGSQTMPLVILVGQNTKGYAEIFAASMQASERAVVVGEHTPGEVETQSSYYLPDGSRMILQSASFRLADGGELGTTGIVPDVLVPAGWDQIQPNQDPVLDQAIEIIGSIK